MGNTHAFLYKGAGLADIGTLGGTYSQGTSINNRGEIAGISTVANGATHLFLYAQGHMHDLGTQVDRLSPLRLLNDRGEILASTAPSGNVGTSYLLPEQQLLQTAFSR